MRERKTGLRPDTLILLEHEPVITLGRNADPSGVTGNPDRLARLGISIHRSERGGQVTYHGPGQIVGYPILDLRDRRIGVKQYVGLLEEVMIRAASRFGVTAYRVKGRPGIFCERGKLGAVGVAVTRGITFHGFAFNVRPDLEHFRFIVPCGLTDVFPTSLEALLEDAPAMPAAFHAIAQSFEAVFQVTLTSTPSDSPHGFRRGRTSPARSGPDRVRPCAHSRTRNV